MIFRFSPPNVIAREIITMLIIYTCSRSSAGRGRLPYNLPQSWASPRTGRVRLLPPRRRLVRQPGTSWVQAGSCNTSVIRLGKWRHLARRQLRLKPHGPVRKLLSQIIPLKSGQFLRRREERRLWESAALMASVWSRPPLITKWDLWIWGFKICDLSL